MEDTHIKSEPPKKESWVPTTKTTVGGFGGALAAVLVWVLKETTSMEMPGEIAVMFGTVVTSVVAYLVPART